MIKKCPQCRSIHREEPCEGISPEDFQTSPIPEVKADDNGFEEWSNKLITYIEQMKDMMFTLTERQCLIERLAAQSALQTKREKEGGK